MVIMTTVFTLKNSPVNEQTKSLWDARLWQLTQDSPMLILVEEWLGNNDAKKATVVNIRNHEYYLDEWDYGFVQSFYHRDEMDKDLHWEKV